MYGKLYLVDPVLVYVQYFSILYLMCTVMTNYIVNCMHALTVTSRPKVYIFNVTLTPVSGATENARPKNAGLENDGPC